MKFNEDKFAKNIKFLREINSTLADSVENASKLISWEHSSVPNDVDLLLNNRLYLNNVQGTLDSGLVAQLKSPSRILFQQLVSSKPVQSVLDLLHQLVDSEELVTVKQLASLKANGNAEKKRSDIKFDGTLLPRDLIVFGALRLSRIDELCVSQQIHSIALVESDPAQLAASLYLIDFEGLVSTLKEKKVKFNLIYDQNFTQLPVTKARILEHFSSNNPMAFHALGMLKSPVLSPDLIRVCMDGIV